MVFFIRTDWAAILCWIPQAIKSWLHPGSEAHSCCSIGLTLLRFQGLEMQRMCFAPVLCAHTDVEPSCAKWWGICLWVLPSIISRNSLSQQLSGLLHCQNWPFPSVMPWLAGQPAPWNPASTLGLPPTNPANPVMQSCAAPLGFLSLDSNYVIFHPFPRSPKPPSLWKKIFS